MPPPPNSENNTETENDLHPISVREMIEDFNSLAAEDTDLDLNQGKYIWDKRGICELFDFSSKHWETEHRNKGLRSLEEELEFYNLLSGHDIDAAGVEESNFCDYR
jgi:hypothetical protein